jgi:hypothetical protein
VLFEGFFVLDSKTKQGVCSFDIQLSAHVRPVVLYRAVVDGKLIPNLLAGKAIGDQAENAPL